MSEEIEADSCSCCASCGVAEIDDIKLMPCDGCDLVRYCSDDCMEHHKLQHNGACKKRAAELRDELLFKQPEGTHLGDCPICCVPLSFNRSTNGLWSCCSKRICLGCQYANELQEIQARRASSCPFCRKPIPTPKETDKQRMKRVKANDPVAIYCEGGAQNKKGYYSRAFKYFQKAAELGDVQAHFKLMGKVLRRIWGNTFTILRRLLLVVIPSLDSILEVTNTTMEMSREQRNIGASLPRKEMMNQSKR